MAETATRGLLTQKELQNELKVSKWFIDERIRRYPKGSSNPFPVERLGDENRARRRFELDKVRAWLAAEADGFASETAA